MDIKGKGTVNAFRVDTVGLRAENRRLGDHTKACLLLERPCNRRSGPQRLEDRV